MKKTSSKKLGLSKITVANLSTTQLENVAGGQFPVDFTLRSVCAEQCCGSDINAQCRTQ
jgi:hypothetical protein